MNLTYISKTRNFDYKKYQDDLNYLALKTFSTLNLNEDYALSCIVVGDKKIKEINRDYRNIDRVTDVITFALRDNKEEYDTLIPDIEEELGDIFINKDAAIRQAEEYNHSLRREFCFLFIHGLLHLLGYDHQNREEEEEMFSLQKEILDSYIPFDDKE